MSLRSTRILSECVSKILEPDEVFSDKYLHSCFPDLMVCLSLKNIAKSRLILLSHQNAFLTPDLNIATPSQFVSSILYLCRYKYPLLAEPLSLEFIPNKWYKCKCQKCPCIGPYTPLVCGSEIHTFDWLTTKLSHMFLSNAEVDKLFGKLGLKSLDIVREEVLLTRLLSHKHLSAVFEDPSAAARRFLRKTFGSIVTRPSKVWKPTACGCGGCPVWKKIYWESLGECSHVSETQTSLNSLVATVTFFDCKTPLVTKHTWMKEIFNNVVSLNTDPLYCKMPAYEAFNELVNSIGISEEDLGHLCKGDLPKRYYNIQYGARSMMILVRVMQKGLKIHVPWHTFRDKKVFRKAQPYIDRILMEEKDEEDSHFESFTCRELMTKIRDTELDDVTYTEDFTDLLVAYKFPVVRAIQEFEILPQYEELYGKTLVALNKVAENCVGHVEHSNMAYLCRNRETNLAQWLEGNANYGARVMAFAWNNFKGEMGDYVHACRNPKSSSNVSKVCVHVGGKLGAEMRRAEREIRTNLEIQRDNRALRRKRAEKGNEAADKKYEESLQALGKISNLVITSGVVPISLDELQALEPDNLLSLNEYTERSPPWRKLVTYGMFLLARSVRTEVNSHLGKIGFPFYFDAHLRVQKYNHGTPIGVSSDYHLDVLRESVRLSLKKESLTDIINRVLQERSELETTKRFVVQAAKVLRRKILKQTQSRRLRAQISLLTPAKIIAVQHSINHKSCTELKREHNLSNGVFKRLALLSVPNRANRSRRPYS
jgi:hypothetical protein